MKKGITWRRVRRGAALLMAAFLLLTAASLPLGVAGTAAAQSEEAESEAPPAPYAALQACEVGMTLEAGEGCHAAGSGTSFVVGRGSGCIVLFEPSLLAVCHAAATDSSAVLSAGKSGDDSWTIEELAETPGSCGELTGLHEAVRLGNAEWVACLAVSGADVNARDERGDTPLHIAVEKGSVDLVRILIAAGADVSLISHDERPVPIGLRELNQVFASAGSDASLQGAEIVAKAERGVTPLQTAVESGDVELVQMLVVAGMAAPEPAAGTDKEAGPEPTPTPTPTATRVNRALSQGGFLSGTLLHDAIEENNEELVRMLIEAGADVDKSGFMNDTPLHAAIEIGNVEIVRMLVEAGADVNKPGFMSETPLALAVQEGKAEILEVLLSAESIVEPENPVSIEDVSGRTPLIIAVKAGDIELVQTLIASGADLNATDNSENTALHIAVQNGGTELARTLVAAGADILAKNVSGKTALTMATESGDLEMVRLLLDTEVSTDEPAPETTAEPSG